MRHKCLVAHSQGLTNKNSWMGKGRLSLNLFGYQLEKAASELREGKQNSGDGKKVEKLST